MHQNNRLGEEVLRPPKRYLTNSTTIRKLVSFVFKYRPIGQSYSFLTPLTQELNLFFEAVLMADDIAPKVKNTPYERKPLADPEDVLDLTLDDEVHVRRKKRKANGTTDAVFKTEIKKERSIVFNNEIIDLTT
jgi:hypothetical protein